MNIAADFLGSWYYISSSGILIKTFELMQHKCNHLCNRLCHFHNLIDVVWPFLSAWSAVCDLWPMVLVLARCIPAQSLINFNHRLWSSSAQQPDHSLVKLIGCVLSDHVCVCFLCPWKSSFIHLLSWRSSIGGGMLGFGCSYWLALCVLFAVMMCCYTSDPTAVWPWSSHTLTLRSVQQQGCENTMPDICFPPVEWNSRELSQIFLQSVSLVVFTFWHENKAFPCTGYLQVLKGIEFSFLKNLRT